MLRSRREMDGTTAAASLSAARWGPSRRFAAISSSNSAALSTRALWAAGAGATDADSPAKTRRTDLAVVVVVIVWHKRILDKSGNGRAQRWPHTRYRWCRLRLDGQRRRNVEDRDAKISHQRDYTTNEWRNEGEAAPNIPIYRRAKTAHQKAKAATTAGQMQAQERLQTKRSVWQSRKPEG
ncbi:hypothetical protein DFJ73DRAFT_341135 [Zopfochytrium polystomum]|nr:hypothetical protein DFJ73DRAFT_341135 [Zopfochytrium polystomum]